MNATEMSRLILGGIMIICLTVAAIMLKNPHMMWFMMILAIV